MNHNASVLEIIGAAINVLGILAAGWMLLLDKARHDAVLATGGTRWGPRIIAAWRHFRCEGARIAYHVVTLVLTLWAMTLPEPTSAYGYASMLARVALAAVFTVMSALDIASHGRLASLLGPSTHARRGAP